LKKRQATKQEIAVCEKYFKLGYEVYRSPMSLLPFDVLAIHPEKGEILFIEVKSGKAELSRRQREFKALIDRRLIWKVKYHVERV